MGYYIDLKDISLDKYKSIVRNTELIPSWKILQNDIDDNIDAIKRCGVDNLDELLAALKSKDKIKVFAKESGVEEEYLTILRRMVNGYKQKPNRIVDFACVDENTIIKLDEEGIKNTLKLYDWVLTPENREALSNKIGISKGEIMMLTKLTDLSRIRWVNHTFAFVLLQAGYDTTEKVANADYQELYETIKQLNEEKKIYNAHIGLKDMKMVVEAAKELTLEIEY